MAKKQHMSRLAAPVTWPIARKGIKWITKPIPGAHSLQYSLPLNVILRDLIGLTKTTKDVKKIINNKHVRVNAKIIRRHNLPVGLFDVIALPAIEKAYRIIINKGKLGVIEIPGDQANILPLKLKDKKTLAKGKIQFNFNNGWNILLEKSELKTGDVALIDVNKMNVSKELKLEKGSTAYLIGGKHSGRVAKLEAIREEGVLRKRKIALMSDGDEKWESLVDYVFVIGKDKPEIKVE